jgi:hypothetical protein
MTFFMSLLIKCPPAERGEGVGATLVVALLPPNAMGDLRFALIPYQVSGAVRRPQGSSLQRAILEGAACAPLQRYDNPFRLAEAID